jgi:hypothetical protein
MCMKAHHANQCESGMVMSDKGTSGFTGEAAQTCDQYTTCTACADEPSCGWCKTDNKCKRTDRWGASGGMCRPEASFITSSGTCNSRSAVGGGVPVNNELLGNNPANSVNLGSRAPAPVGAQPPSGADLSVAASPESSRRNMPATGAINAPGAGTVAADATTTARPAGTAANASTPQVGTCGSKVSFKLSELPAIEAKIKNDILKVLASTRA